MLQTEIARGDQICLEKSVEAEMAAEIRTVQFFDRFPNRLPLVDACGVARVRLPGEGIQH